MVNNNNVLSISTPAQSAPQDLKIKLHQLYTARAWPELLHLSEQIVAQWPSCAISMRFLGIARLINGKKYATSLAQAASLGDADAVLWQATAQAFLHYPKGSFLAEDICAHVNYLAKQNSVYMDYPSEITLETQAICNARCVFCPYATVERKGQRMSDELIAKILHELTEIPQHIPFSFSPFKLSDPFLDKRIFSICERVNQTLPQATIRLFSNGTPLTPKMIDKIARIQKVDCLWVSLNEYEPEPYYAAMRLPFERVIANLDHLHKLVETGYPHQVHLSRVGDNSKRDQVFTTFVSNRYPRFASTVLTRGTWTGQVGTEIQYRVPPTPCVRWFELSIMANGKVALCCQDGAGEHIVGDVNTQTVFEVYNSSEYKKLRQYCTSRLGAAYPCSNCYVG